MHKCIKEAIRLRTIPSYFVDEDCKTTPARGMNRSRVVKFTIHKQKRSCAPALHTTIVPRVFLVVLLD
jgi:hypothetical protein